MFLLKIFRWTMVLWWAAMLFIFTCSASLEETVRTLELQLMWESTPNLSEVWSPMPDQPGHYFWIRKSGHAGAFFIFTVLLGRVFKKNPFMTLFISCAYAASTEFLQLYFSRDGRLFDIGFDFAGIFIGMAVMALRENKPLYSAAERK
jgi:VanZ family protein